MVVFEQWIIDQSVDRGKNTYSSFLSYYQAPVISTGKMLHR